MYRLLVDDGLSTRAITVILNERGVPTARGASQWKPTTVNRILQNPANKGALGYQRTRAVLPRTRINTDPYNNRKTGEFQGHQKSTSLSMCHPSRVRKRGRPRRSNLNETPKTLVATTSGTDTCCAASSSARVVVARTRVLPRWVFGVIGVQIRTVLCPVMTVSARPARFGETRTKSLSEMLFRTRFRALA